MGNKEFWTIIGVIVAFGLGLAGLIVSQNASIRSDINARHASLSADIDGINAELYDMNTRLSRIEGGLFGIEIPEIDEEPEEAHSP